MKYIGKIGSVRILLSIVCVNRQNKCTVGKHIIDILFCYYYYYIHFRYIVIVNRKSFTLRLNICIHVIVASIPIEVIRDRGTISDIPKTSRDGASDTPHLLIAFSHNYIYTHKLTNKFISYACSF